MDGRGGCCIARYGPDYERSKMDLILLKYRPIAPKPTTSGAVSGGSEVDDNVKDPSRRKRRRRSNAKGTDHRTGGTARGRKSKEAAVVSEKGRKREDNTRVTLPLLPEKPDLGKAPVYWLNFDQGSSSSNTKLGEEGWPGEQKKVVGSWVIVESVTDTYGGMMMMMTSTDEEKRSSLEEDTCPGFISDCWNKVGWTNKAYREMASEMEVEVVVWLVMREKLPPNCEAFTCRVTVQSAAAMPRRTMTLPCDVWRMSDGGFAWRMDVKAALSLGR